MNPFAAELDLLETDPELTYALVLVKNGKLVTFCHGSYKPGDAADQARHARNMACVAHEALVIAVDQAGHAGYVKGSEKK
jgi:hypothetical protein